jgi:putative Holliday junction resolvase
MGLDYGTRRIGVAISDLLHITAQPHEVLEAEAADLDEKLQRLVSEREVSEIVVGLPVSLSGYEGASAASARALGERVGVLTGLPVHFYDERFTSKTANEVLIAGKVRRAERKQVVDKVAAAVMLQQWLGSRP